MAPLAGISGKDAIKRFECLGYRVIRQKGSHARLRHSDPSRRPLTIPLHKELKIGLLHQLLKDAGVDIDSFLNL